MPQLDEFEVSRTGLRADDQMLWFDNWVRLGRVENIGATTTHVWLKRQRPDSPPWFIFNDYMPPNLGPFRVRREIKPPSAPADQDAGRMTATVLGGPTIEIGDRDGEHVTTLTADEALELFHALGDALIELYRKGGE